MTAELEALAVRVETLTGPDRAIDAEIALAAGWARPRDSGQCGPAYAGREAYEWHDPEGVSRGFAPPKFTASLDAAMTLVPEGWRVSELSQLSGAPNWTVLLWVDDGNVKLKDPPTAGGFTAALALTAAALRARAASVNEPLPDGQKGMCR